MNIFKYLDYRKLIEESLKNRPSQAPLSYKKIAESLRVHTSQISQIMAGHRELTVEQAHELAALFDFTKTETDYFILLVQKERAGTASFKKYCEEKLKKIVEDSRKLSQRFDHEKTLTDEEKSIFYSDTIYSSVRLFCSLKEKGMSMDEILERFELPKERLVQVLNFLIATGLLIQKNERYVLGISSTFLPGHSPFIQSHHRNWRLKALQEFPRITEEEMMFTAPMSISRKDFAEIRETLAQLIGKLSAKIKDSPAEDIACLNLDYFWIRKA